MKFNYTLLVKYLFDSLSEEELCALLRWRNESISNEQLFDTLIKLRINLKFKACDTSERTLYALAKVNEKLQQKQPYYKIKRFARYAAILLVLFSLSFGILDLLPKKTPDTSIRVEQGETIKKLNLKDGTVVWLNEGATLKIPPDFSASKRYVSLKGEAYFDVKENKEVPFFVDASSMQVKVTGTSFSLNNRIDEGDVETVLVTGKVFLLNKEGEKVYDMFPGEKVVYTPNQNEYVVKTVDTNVSTAWHLNQLTFENSTLREIVNKLSLIYDVNINLESKRLADRKYRCVINRDETLEEVLGILKYLAPISYKIEGDEVFIYE